MIGLFDLAVTFGSALIVGFFCVFTAMMLYTYIKKHGGNKT